MHPRLTDSASASIAPPGWTPSSWLPYVPALERGDHCDLDIPALLDAGILVPTFSGTVVPLPLLMNGIVLTHRLSAGEAAGGFLDLDPDLSPLHELAQAGIPLAGGGAVRQATMGEAAEAGLDPMHMVLTGPGGWLAGFEPGDDLAVRWVEGVLVIQQTTAPAPRRADARALRHTFHRMMDQLVGAPPLATTIRELVREVLIAGADRWSDVEAPLGEQLAAAGFATAHGWVGEPGVDLSGYRPQPTPPVPMGAFLAEFPEAPEKAALEQLDRAVNQYRIGVLDEGAAHLRELAALLGRPGMARAFLGWNGLHEGFAEVLTTLLPHAHGRARSVAHLLLACVAECEQRPEDYGRHLARALEDDPSPETLRKAATLAEIAGDVGNALALHHRAGEHGDPEAVARLERLGDTPDRPLAARAPWLWEKARAFLVDMPDTDAWDEVAGAVPDGMDVMYGLFAGFFTECVLFDLGGLERFLALHAERLPADERTLAESWLGAPWRLWHLEEVAPGREAVVTDVVADDRRRVLLGPGERDLVPGTLLLGRVLPTGERDWLAYGALPLDDSERAAGERVAHEGISGVALVRLLAGGG